MIYDTNMRFIDAQRTAPPLFTVMLQSNMGSGDVKQPEGLWPGDPAVR